MEEEQKVRLEKADIPTTLETGGGTPGLLPKEPKQKKSNRMPLILCAVALLLVIGAVLALGNGGGGGSDPKSIVQKAVTDTWKAAEAMTPGMLELSGAKAVSEKLLEQAVEQDGSLTLKTLSSGLSDMAVLEDSGIKFDARTDYAAKKMDMNLALAYAGTSVLGMNFYTDNKVLMFGMPALFDGQILVDAANFMEAYNNSYFGMMEKLEGDPEDYDLRIFPSDEQKAATDEASNEMLKALQQMTQGSRKALYDHITVYEMADGTEVEAFSLLDEASTDGLKGYEVNIPGEDMQAYLSDVHLFLKEDNIMREALTAAAASQYAQNPGYGSPDRYLEEFYQSVDTIFEALDKFFEKDLAVYCYVNEQGLLTMMGTTLTGEEENGALDLALQLKGTDNIYDSIVFRMGENGVALPVFEFAKETSLAEALYQNEMGISFWDPARSERQILTISMNTQYDKDTTEFEASIFVVSPEDEEQMGIAAEGTLVGDTNANTIDCTISNLDLIMDLNGAKDRIGMAANYHMGPYDGEIAEPDGKQLDVLAMSEAELQQLIMEIYTNAFSFLMMFQ